MGLCWRGVADWFLGLTILLARLASAVSIRPAKGEGHGYDGHRDRFGCCRGTARGRLHGVDDRPVREDDQGTDELRRGTRRRLHALAGRAVRVDDGQPAHWPVQCPAQVRLRPAGQVCSTPMWQTGRVDLSARKRGGGGARPESGEFTALAAAWEADMGDRGLAPATRDAYGRVARGYLVFLESRGVRCLGDADGASVLGFLESLSGRWARSSLFWVVSNFRPFLKFTGRADLVDAAGLAGVRRSHAILPVLGDDDERWSCTRARRGRSARGMRPSPCWR